MKIHPYAINAFTDRPPFTDPRRAAAVRSGSGWELAAASLGGILLGLLGFLLG